MLKIVGEMYFYTRVWIKLGFRFPPGPPLSKDVAKIMFLTAIYVNFLWNLLTAIIVNFNLYWSSHCYGGGIQWEGKMIAFRINICILGFTTTSRPYRHGHFSWGRQLGNPVISWNGGAYRPCLFFFAVCDTPEFISLVFISRKIGNCAGHELMPR